MNGQSVTFFSGKTIKTSLIYINIIYNIYMKYDLKHLFLNET